MGGPAARLVRARSEAEVVAAVRAADRAGEPVLVLAGGSNLLVADDGVPGTVVRLEHRGSTLRGDVLEVAAGEPWDELVARVVEDGRAGIECLAGIPGSVGATPVQNVGAYGQEVRETVVGVRALHRPSGEIVELDPEACGFGYRTSAFKGRDEHVLLAVRLALPPADASRPVRYAEFARSLGIAPGERAPLAAVRAAVLALRRGKGMVLDPADHDTWSAGSFFTNPVVEAAAIDGIRARAGAEPPAWPEPDGRLKTSAAWLIERAGFGRGHGLPGPAALSTKHALALTNRGGATAADLLALAREVRDGVAAAFAIRLEPEPVLVGCALG